MSARIIQFPDRMSSPVTVPPDHVPEVIILPVVRIERGPTLDDLAMRLVEARRRRRLKKLPKAFLSLA